MDEAVSGAPRPSSALEGAPGEEDVRQAASSNKIAGLLAKDTTRRVASTKSSARPGEPSEYTRCIVGWTWRGEGRQPAQPNDVAVAKALRQALGPSSVAFVTLDMFDYNKGYAFVGLTEDALVGTLGLPVGSKSRSSVAILVGSPGASAWTLKVSQAFQKVWDPKVTPKKAGGDPSTVLKSPSAQLEPPPGPDKGSSPLAGFPQGVPGRARLVQGLPSTVLAPSGGAGPGLLLPSAGGAGSGAAEGTTRGLPLGGGAGRHETGPLLGLRLPGRTPSTMLHGISTRRPTPLFLPIPWARGGGP